MVAAKEYENKHFVSTSFLVYSTTSAMQDNYRYQNIPNAALGRMGFRFDESRNLVVIGTLERETGRKVSLQGVTENFDKESLGVVWMRFISDVPDTSVPTAPDKASLTDIKTELESIRKTQNSIMEEVLKLKNIASRGDVLALTATIESSKIGDAAIPIAYVAGDLRGIVADIRDVCDKACELSEGTKALNDKLDKLLDDKALEINDKADTFSKEVEAKLGEISATVKTSKDKVDSLSGAGTILDDVSQSIRDKARKNSETVDTKLKSIGEVFANIEKADEDFGELQSKMKTAISNVNTDETIYEKIGDLLEQIRPIIQED